MARQDDLTLSEQKETSKKAAEEVVIEAIKNAPVQATRTPRRDSE